MRRLFATGVLTCSVLVSGSLPASANDRDAYEAGLGQPVRELAPPALLGHRWDGTGSGIAGRVVLSRGELVLDDRPFDDTGADTLPRNGPPVQSGVDAATLSGFCNATGSFSTGDLAYPAGDAYRKNSSDLVQVRLAVQAGRLHVLWQLQTLVTASSTSVALLVDTDRDATTGAAEGFTGFDQAVVVRGAVGSLGKRAVQAAVDLRANTVEAVLPLSALPPGPWRVNAVAAVLPSGELADAALVADEPVTGARACKLDQVQAGRLAQRRLDGVPVDPRRLAAGASDPSRLVRGSFTRHYVPELALGEGRVGQARYGQEGSADIYRGTVQPYAVYVPSTYDPAKKNPVILLLHCLNCWHSVYAMSDLPTELAESRGALIVTPFGYGEGGHYEREAQKDVFEVLSDVSRRYSVDQERLYLTGMSMGSLGTYRLGGLFPDLWARLLAVESYTTPFCITPTPRTPACSLPFNYLDLFPNYGNVPVGIVQGALDELTPVTGGREFADTLTRLDYPFRYWEWPTRTHDPKMHGLTTDVTDAFLGDGRRVRDPARVSYVQDRAMQTPGQVYERAYWLSGMRLADGLRFGRVDAVSGRGSASATTPVQGSGSDAAGPFTFRGLDRTPAAPSGRNELTVTVAGLDRLTVDLPAARLTRSEPLTVVAQTDRPVRVTLGRTTLSLPAGASRAVLAADASGRPTRVTVDRAEGALPATGPGWPPAVAALVVLAALLVSRAGRTRLRGRCPNARLASREPREPSAPAAVPRLLARVVAA